MILVTDCFWVAQWTILDTMHQIRMTGSRGPRLSLSTVMMMFNSFLPEFFFANYSRKFKLELAKTRLVQTWPKLAWKSAMCKFCPTSMLWILFPYYDFFWKCFFCRSWLSQLPPAWSPHGWKCSHYSSGEIRNYSGKGYFDVINLLLSYHDDHDMIDWWSLHGWGPIFIRTISYLLILIIVNNPQ